MNALKAAEAIGFVAGRTLGLLIILFISWHLIDPVFSKIGNALHKGWCIAEKEIIQNGENSG